MVDRKGNVVQVPHDQASEAYSSGQLGFVKGSQVQVVGSDGTVGSVDAEHAGKVLAGGGRLASPDEFRQASLDKKYGGVGGTLAAAGEGAARGLSVGLSDPVAIGLTQAFGGDKAAEKVRQHLAEEKEAHPYVSAAGEIAGAALPVLASGGAAAPEEAATLGGEAVTGGGKLAAAMRALGAPAGAVSKAGEIAAKATERLVGEAPGASGALARIAKAAAKSGAQIGAEGALFGGGQEISEDALGDHELTAEKFAAALGHGALYGLMTGGVLGGAGEAGKAALTPILNRVAPGIERQADTQMWKALSPLKKYTSQAESRAGGADAVGRVLREELDLPANPLKAAMGPEELAPKIDEAVDRVGKQIGDTIENNAHARVKLSEMTKPIEERIAKFEGVVGGEDKVATLTKLRDSVREILGGEAPVVEAAAPVRRTPEEVASFLKENPKVAAEMAMTGKLPQEAAFKMPAAAPRLADPEISIADAIKQRRALQQIAFEESKSLDPKMRVQVMRDITSEWGKLEESALNRASEATGGEEGTNLRDLNKRYQQLRIAQDAVNDTTSRMATNRNLSLTDYLTGAAHAPGMLLSGHPLAAVGALASSVAHKFIREKGNAAAAVALGRIAKLDLLARASEKVDADLSEAISNFAKEGPKSSKIRLRHFGATASDEPIEDRYQRSVERAPKAGAPPVTEEHVDRAIPGLSEHAPKTATALSGVVNNGASWLASKQPQLKGAPDLLGRVQKPTPEEMSAFVRQERAVNDPVGTIVRGLETGKIHNDEIEAIQASKPKLFAQIQQQALAEAAKNRKSMDYGKLVTLSKIAQVPLDKSLTPESVAYYQSTYTAPGAGPKPGPAPTRGAPKRQLKGIAQAATLSVGQTSDQ